MSKVLGKFITEIGIQDPDTGAMIDVEIYKDPQSGALFGIDSSFLEEVQEFIYSPFNKDSVIELPESNLNHVR